MDVQYFTQKLQMQEGSSSTECGSDVISYHHNLDKTSSQPILILVHGYPES